MSARAPSFNYAPLALIAATLALGILCAKFLLIIPVNLPLAPLACLCCALATLCAVWFVAGRSQRDVAAMVCVLVAVFAAGAALFVLQVQAVGSERIRRMLDEKRINQNAPIEITGTVENIPEQMPDGFSFVLQVESIRDGKTREPATPSGQKKENERHTQAAGRIRLFAHVSDAATLRGYEQLELRNGARLRLLIELQRDAGFRDPGVESRLTILDRNDLDATATLKSPLLVERLDDVRVFLPGWWLARLRANLLARTHDLFEPQTAGLLGAMLLGHEGFITREVGERFRAGGTYHVLVVSGMHITIIGFVVLLIVRRFTSRSLWQFLIPAIFIWAYSLAIGANVSVVRAAVMFTCALFALKLNRPARSLNLLGAAALLLLVWHPATLFHPSFQLTFLSVFAITVLAAPLIARLKEAGEWQPTMQTPYPPRCSVWWRTLGEILFWNERQWRSEMRRNVFTYKLRKATLAKHLNRLRLQLAARYVFGIVLVSACIQIVMLPMLIVMFHRISVASLFLNLIVALCVGIVSVAALISLLLAALSQPLAAPFVFLTQATNNFMLRTFDPFIEADLLSFTLPSYTGAAASVYVFYYVALAFLLVALSRWRLTLRGNEPDAFVKPRTTLAFASLLALLACIILIHPRSADAERGRLRIDFLDVGQGDAALVTFPDGTTLLVDGGGRQIINKRFNANSRSGFAQTGNDDVWMSEASSGVEYDRRSIGESVVCEYLWWRGLRQVDYVLATHPDTDHIEGLNAVVKNFAVRSAFIGSAPAADSDHIEFVRSLSRHQVPLQPLRAGDVLKVGGVRIEVLNPTNAKPSSRINDDSVVLRLTYGSRSILLTGDIERQAEAKLTETTAERLRADVVKIAHHGSRTSSIEEFVRATRASVAVISVGRDSQYEHPHREVVTRWRASGARVLRTGEHGTITVSTDGEDLRVKTFIENANAAKGETRNE